MRHARDARQTDAHHSAREDSDDEQPRSPRDLDHLVDAVLHGLLGVGRPAEAARAGAEQLVARHEVEVEHLECGGALGLLHVAEAG